nr:hypothetical protein [Spirochaetaceae bacterium]
ILFRGLIFALIGLLAFWASRFKVDFSYGFLSLIYYSFIFRGGVMIFVCLIGFVIHQYIKPSKVDNFREYLLIWAIIFWVLNLSELISFQGDEGIGPWALAPLMRLAMVIYFSIILKRSFEENSMRRIFIFLIAPAILFIYLIIQSLKYYSPGLVGNILPILFFIPSIYFANQAIKEHLSHGNRKVH